MFGCTSPVTIALTHATASTADAAPSRWPVMHLVELIFAPAALKTRCSTRSSAMSPAGVDVACALT